MMASPPARSGQVGPNAITQVIAALTAELGSDRMAALVAGAGLGRHLQTPPGAMVSEDDVAALQRAVRADLAPALAERVLADAGRRTADYLLAHRIPALAQQCLRLLPAWAAARLLIRAIGGHAWTFAGSGTFAARFGAGLTITITGCPLAIGQRAEAPVCALYAGVFTRLFQVLVSPATQVREIACEATGAPACVFAVTWRTPRARTTQRGRSAEEVLS